VLEQIHRKLLDLAGRTPPKGLLGQAVAYGLGQWERSPATWRTGGLQPITIWWRTPSAFTVGPAELLFYDRPDGAAAGATIYSLIETPRHGLEPFAYLRHVFEQLPRRAPGEPPPTAALAREPGGQSSPATRPRIFPLSVT
jgi:hypothetical protein